jgi:hypothetical protein
VIESDFAAGPAMLLILVMLVVSILILFASNVE